jgi:DNA replication protein DnaC
MNEELKNKLKYLKFNWLLENGDNFFKELEKKRTSNYKAIIHIIEQEYLYKKESARATRIKNAKIPEYLVLETYPFSKQPELKKALIQETYDSLSYVTNCCNLLLIGPTGCGKTGLATAFLINAINNGYRGFFIDFVTLIRMLYQSKGDFSESKIIKKMASIDILLIDEVGYESLIKETASLFFELIRCRHKKKATIITTQLGFDEWNGFLPDPHITAALLDRLTVDCIVFNMTNCVSIREKNIIYGTENNKK